ncbi:hypothetical protein RSAG8_10986, partial [Rhizoctonia solani AG-8 WAC10335]
MRPDTDVSGLHMPATSEDVCSADLCAWNRNMIPLISRLRPPANETMSLPTSIC